MVGDDRPLFRWSGTPPFTVEIFDDRMQLVAATKRIDDTEWKATSALPRGRTLMWQVRRDRDGSSEIAPRPPEPPARFRIVTTAARHAIDAASSPLEAALLYAREGMVEEAREKMRGRRGDGHAFRDSADDEGAGRARQRSRPMTMNGAQ